MGISQADIGLMASQAMEQTRLLPNNPREVGEKDAAALYEMTL